MSFLWLTILSALRILRRNPLRAGLTMLGIIIGIGAVVAMVSLGQGATASVQAEIASLGTNVLIIVPGATTVGGVRGGARLHFDADGRRCGGHREKSRRCHDGYVRHAISSSSHPGE